MKLPSEPFRSKRIDDETPPGCSPFAPLCWLVPAPTLAPRPGLVILTGVLALLTYLVLASIPPSPSPNGGFALPAAAASPNLDSKARAEVIEDAPAEVVQASHEEPSPPPQPTTPEPPPPLTPPPAAEPVPAIAPSDSQPGGPPMSSPKDVTIKIMLTGWFFSFPAVTATAQDKETPPTPGQTATSLQKIENDLTDLKKQVKALADKLNSDMPTATHLDSLTKAISDLRAEISKLELAGRNVEPRRSLSITPPAPANGYVSVVNDWWTPNTVVIDGVSYRLNPGQRRTVNKPAGNFQYEVLNVQPPVSSFVRAGETVTITIGP